MNRIHLLVAVLGIAFVSGCASTDKQAALQDDDKTYVTGSRIPVKDTSHPNVSAVTDKKDINEMMHRGGNATGGVQGAGACSILGLHRPAANSERKIAIALSRAMKAAFGRPSLSETSAARGEQDWLSIDGRTLTWRETAGRGTRRTIRAPRASDRARPRARPENIRGARS